MEQVQIFENSDFGEIRTITKDNEVWFVAKDVSKILGYKETANMRKLIEKEDCLEIDPQNVENTGFVQNGMTVLEPNINIRRMLLINESGLYQAIFNSTLPNAKKFKRWVTSEILPTIRKTGTYQVSSNPFEQIKLIATGFVQLDERMSKLENTMTLDYAQQQSLTKAVNKVVIDVLGGKNSNAYQELGKKVFAECNRDIKDFFCVNARNNIPKLRFIEAMEYVKNWQPKTNTKLAIQDCNAQMSMG